MQTQPTKCPPKVRGRCCEERIAIAAPAEAVWSVLADFANWPQWNPLYVATEGTLRSGEQITVAISLPGMKPQRAHPTVTVVEPPRLIEYSTRTLGGLLRACRYIEITATGPTSCRVSNGEIMGGLLGGLVFRLVATKLRAGLKAMNEGLKAKAEATTRA